MDEGPIVLDDARSPDPTPFLDLLVRFGEELRHAGVPVGPGDQLAFCAAIASLDPGDLLDVYWAGRATLVTRRAEIPVYDRVFRGFFLSHQVQPPEPVKLAPPQSIIEYESVIEVPAGEPLAAGKDEQEARLGFMASDIEIWRNKAFSACSEEELAALRRIMAQVRVIPPRRRSRRTDRSPSGGKPDLRRTVRTSMRMHGEPAELYWRQRRLKARPLVLILDISGSMSDYSRNLLQFAYSAKRAAGRVEVFCFGTRLTRITRSLDRRRPDDALEHAANSVFDWEGGTRIGDSIDAFVRQFGRRGMSRGAIVVICSDGLDRGDPAVLAGAMERLSRLCHKVVWMNPHKGANVDFRPTTLGMMVVEPHIDLLLSGHDLASLEDLAHRLPELR